MMKFIKKITLLTLVGASMLVIDVNAAARRRRGKSPAPAPVVAQAPGLRQRLDAAVVVADQASQFVQAGVAKVQTVAADVRAGVRTCQTWTKTAVCGLVAVLLPVSYLAALVTGNGEIAAAPAVATMTLASAGAALYFWPRPRPVPAGPVA